MLIELEPTVSATVAPALIAVLREFEDHGRRAEQTVIRVKTRDGIRELTGPNVRPSQTLRAAIERTIRAHS